MAVIADYVWKLCILILGALLSTLNLLPDTLINFLSEWSIAVYMLYFTPFLILFMMLKFAELRKFVKVRMTTIALILFSLLINTVFFIVFIFCSKHYHFVI